MAEVICDYYSCTNNDSGECMRKRIDIGNGECVSVNEEEKCG